MAKITYISPVKTVSGKLAKKDKVIYLTRRAATSNEDMIANPCYTAVMGTRSTPVTQTERDLRERFGKICKGTLQRLKDPTHQATDQAGFKAQTQYKTLKQYVWHQVADSIE